MSIESPKNIQAATIEEAKKTIADEFRDQFDAAANSIKQYNAAYIEFMDLNNIEIQKGRITEISEAAQTARHAVKKLMNCWKELTKNPNWEKGDKDEKDKILSLVDETIDLLENENIDSMEQTALAFFNANDSEINE